MGMMVASWRRQNSRILMGVPETLSSPSGDCGTSGLALLRTWKIGAGFIIIPRLPRILTPQVLSLNSFFSNLKLFKNPMWPPYVIITA